MKTLTDLKKYCDKYEWKLLNNSHYLKVPDYQSCYRKVITKRSQSFSLATNIEGEVKESWIDFPKASELDIKANEEGYILTITRKSPFIDQEAHVMVYQLRLAAKE